MKLESEIEAEIEVHQECEKLIKVKCKEHVCPSIFYNFYTMSASDYRHLQRLLTFGIILFYHASKSQGSCQLLSKINVCIFFYFEICSLKF